MNEKKDSADKQPEKEQKKKPISVTVQMPTLRARGKSKEPGRG